MKTELTVKEFLKTNIKPLVAILSVVVVLIVSMTILNVSNSVKNSDAQKIDTNADYLLPVDVTLSTPIMYDFVNGTLGLNEDYVDMVQGDKVFIATRPDSDTCYVSFLSYNELGDPLDNLFPKFSPEPYAYTFESTAQKDSFLDWLKNGFVLYGDVCESEVVPEGDYTFYITGYGALDNGCEKRDDFKLGTVIKNQKPGKMRKAIDGGMGIPTYIIREKCDLEALKNYSTRTDFTLPFWDNVNYQEHLKCYKKGSTTEYVVITPDMAHLTSDSLEWYPTFAINDCILSPASRLEDIEKLLANDGFESTSEAIARGAYTPELEGNVSVKG